MPNLPHLKPPIPKTTAPRVTGALVRSNKTFTIADWGGENEGEKIMLYGRSGIGKTTLAALAPDPVWIGLDDGGRKIRHPVTGQPLRAVPDIETFEDIRAALQSDVFDGCKTIVLDTVTELQNLGMYATFRRVPAGQGSVAQTIEDYGYNKGYRHWLDTMRLILGDCDRHIRAGRNILMLAQMRAGRRANPGGEDYLVDGPSLYHAKDVSVLDAYMEWCDHVLRLELANLRVDKQKKASSTNERAVFVHPEVHFLAKSRTISKDYPVVEFKEPSDDSIWRLIFGRSKVSE